MEMGMEIFLIALLAGFLSLDATAAFQTMVSRPLVVGALTGLILGDGLAGLSVGCLIELIWLGLVPIGSVVVPDFTIAAAFAVAGTIFMMREEVPGVSWEAASVWMLLASLIFAYLGGLAEIGLRRFHTSLARWVDREIVKGNSVVLNYAVIISLVLVFFKGAVITGLGLAIFSPLLGDTLANLPLGIVQGMGWSYWFLLLLGMMVIVDLFWERHLIKYGAVSFVIGFILLNVFKLHLGYLVPVFLAVALLAIAREKRLEVRTA